MKMIELAPKVYESLLLMPKGKVTTYQEIAKFLGNENLARLVGNILHVNPKPNKYPCYKVVNKRGCLAKRFGFGGINEQKRQLIKDGIEVKNYQVDLNKYLFKFIKKAR